MALPDSFLEELRARNDIVSVISNYVTLKRSGRNMVGLCPFHAEKSPSFTVYTNTESFYCFGCAAGGDVITFMRRIENLDYIDAVKFLAQRCGMELPEDNAKDGLSELRIRVFEANREAAKFYNHALFTKEGEAGLAYLKGRGLSDKTINHFGLGYAYESGFALCNHLRKLGFSEYEIIQANLGYKSNRTGALFDKFKNRVIYPLIDLRGNVVAFGGRALEKSEKAKYVNTSDTPVFKKSSNIFALNFAKNTKENFFIIVEGYMDVISLHQAGFDNTIASMGTAFTQEQAQTIARYTNEVVLCFDSDEAGQKANERAIKILRNTGVNIRILRVPGNKDPDEFLRSNPKDAAEKFKLLLERSGNDVEYRLEKIKDSLDTESSEGKVAFLNEAAKLLSTIDNYIERDVYVLKLSEQLNISKEAIKLQIQKNLKKNEKNENKKFIRNFEIETSGRNDRINTQKASNLRAAKAEEMLIAFLFKYPDKVNYIESKITSDDFITDFNRRVFKNFEDRLKEGRNISLADISGDFSIDENSVIVKIINQESGNIDAVNDYIDRILSEKTKQDIKKSDNDEDILKYLNSVKKSKK